MFVGYFACTIAMDVVHLLVTCVMFGQFVLILETLNVEEDDEEEKTENDDVAPSAPSDLNRLLQGGGIQPAVQLDQILFTTVIWLDKLKECHCQLFIINGDVTVRRRRISSRLVPNSSITCSWILRISIIITVSCDHDDKKKNAINWIEYLFSALAASKSHTAYCTRIINSISFHGGKLLVGLGAFFM